MNAPAAQGEATILFVCTANICRSPTAELILKRRLAERGQHGLTIVSAGVAAMAGHPIDAVMGSMLAADGIESTTFAARRLHANDVAEADLILTATAGHRSQIVQLAPRALSRTFTLLEFTRLADHLKAVTAGEGTERLLSLRDAAVAHRNLVLPLDVPQDIGDPYRRSVRHYRRAYQQINQTVGSLVDALAPEPAANSGALAR